MKVRLMLAASALAAFGTAAAQAQAVSAQPTPASPPAPAPAPAPAPPLPGATSYLGALQVCEAARGEHRVRLEGGRRYTIAASSDTFDSYLRLLRPGSEEVLAEDDDGGGGLNARLTFAAPATGDYVVRVTSVSPGGVGNYQLQVAAASPLPALLNRPTRTERAQWRVYQGDLGATDAVDGNRRYDDYELRLAAGQSAMIHLEGGGELDPMLKIYSLAGRGGQAVAENDDAGGGTASFIFFTPPQAGTYVIRVTSFGENGTGAYRLRVSQ